MSTGAWRGFTRQQERKTSRRPSSIRPAACRRPPTRRYSTSSTKPRPRASRQRKCQAPRLSSNSGLWILKLQALRPFPANTLARASVSVLPLKDRGWNRYRPHTARILIHHNNPQEPGILLSLNELLEWDSLL